MLMEKLNIKLLFLAVVLLSVLGACRDDLLYVGDEVPRQDNLPVELDINIKGVATRGPSYFKTDFDPDEIVHVQGVFYLADGDTVVKYAAFRYDGDKWSQYSGATGTGEVPRFTWPNTAVNADFKAYYVYGSNSLMVPTGNPDEDITPVTLSSIVGTSVANPDHDPLKASNKGVKYGHTIILEFIHACAYLTIEEMQPVSDIFWFTQELPNGATSEDFNNAFRLYLDLNNNLQFEFLQVADPEYSGKVYVQGLSSSALIDGVYKSTAGFFLAPGQYMNFVVGYPGSNEMVNYISYSKSNTGDSPGTGDGNDPDTGDGGGDSGNVGGDIEGGPGDEGGDENNPSAPLNPYNELVENGVYTFNVTKSNGVEIVTPVQPDEWDELGDPIYDVDAEKFLWAICNNKEYYVENVQIIKPEGTVSHLLKNVNIQWAPYNIFEPSETNGYTWWEPNLGQGVTFDGGLHYIYNLGSPLFRQVDGVIRRLGIANAKIDVITMDNYTPGMLTPAPEEPGEPDEGGGSDNPSISGPTINLSRQGAICGFLNNGTIENIRVKTQLPPPNVNVDNKYEDVFLMNAYVWGLSSGESHNIGGLIGSNSNGMVNDITIFCDMTINISNYTGPDGTWVSEVPRLFIGGVIGQNVNYVNKVLSGNGTNSITINNYCTGEDASYSIGGFVGLFSGGVINNTFLPQVTIDSSSSTGLTSYIGGIAGNLSNVQNGGQLRDCRIENGTVKAGKCEDDDEGGSAQVNTGGIAGIIYESYLINDCFVTVDVWGPVGDNYLDDGSVDYATGGMFGKIDNLPGQTPSKITNNGAYGSTLRGPGKYIGNFAGTVPAGETWETDYEPNGNEVIPHNLVSGGPIANIGNQQ